MLLKTSKAIMQIQTLNDKEGACFHVSCAFQGPLSGFLLQQRKIGGKYCPNSVIIARGVGDQGGTMTVCLISIITARCWFTFGFNYVQVLVK